MKSLSKAHLKERLTVLMTSWYIAANTTLSARLILSVKHISVQPSRTSIGAKRANPLSGLGVIIMVFMIMSPLYVFVRYVHVKVKSKEYIKCPINNKEIL